MNAQEILFASIHQALTQVYNLSKPTITFQKTRKEFEGDFTLVTFPFIKETKKSPEQLGQELGDYLIANNNQVAAFNVVKGFLNISLSNQFWLNYFNTVKDLKTIGYKSEKSSGKTIMLEYSSPNTNKPLHLGHVRNNLLGFSVAQILKANGHNIIKANLVNDRGIHICKSMLAWQKFGNGETPESTGIKGDHLVGKYYVAFDKAYKKQIEELVAQGKTKEEAEKNAPLIIEAQEMLLKWESGDTEVVNLWKTMNSWVYDGFAITYKTLGVNFDKMYYESNTYLLGKEIIKEGLTKNVFYKKENGSVAIDLSYEGLDEKIVLRSDGTSVYITQDLGTAIERFKEFPQLSQLIYTVGNEQDYHFKVLFKILEKLGYSWAKECYHLSYGMVELPEGKMKSREGTVVDADELLSEMFDTATATTKELGKVDDFNEEEFKELNKAIGLGALKYFILKVDPKKKMLFDPKESIDFNGHTGPFIQYTHARIKSVLRKATFDFEKDKVEIEMSAIEKELVKFVYDFDSVVEESGTAFNPALVANYIYEVTKLYNRFYHDCPILKEEDEKIKIFRLQLSKLCAQAINNAMILLGIEVPEKM
ncbi:MAG: arginine--tRNA ligase [Bacteroidota bacterium]|nr:arginine--tRNA ligase [Bacteroidota bacterium]MDP3147185.1 arginine--tRNA ligase [Bacteroidota bacterium]